jgi:hypothetical protein
VVGGVSTGGVVTGVFAGKAIETSGAQREPSTAVRRLYLTVVPATAGGVNEMPLISEYVVALPGTMVAST